MRRGLSSSRITLRPPRGRALRLKCTDAGRGQNSRADQRSHESGGIWSSQRSHQYAHSKGGVTNRHLFVCAEDRTVHSDGLRALTTSLRAADSCFGFLRYRSIDIALWTAGVVPLPGFSTSRHQDQQDASKRCCRECFQSATSALPCAATTGSDEVMSCI